MTWSSVPLKYMEHYPCCTQGPCHSFMAGLQLTGGITAACFLWWKMGKERGVEHVCVPIRTRCTVRGLTEYQVAKSSSLNVSQCIISQDDDAECRRRLLLYSVMCAIFDNAHWEEPQIKTLNSYIILQLVTTQAQHKASYSDGRMMIKKKKKSNLCVSASVYQSQPVFCQQAPSITTSANYFNMMSTLKISDIGQLCAFYQLPTIRLRRVS